jgi:hemoglobin-like flavoprotein
VRGKEAPPVDIQESLDRILKSEEIIGKTFYDVFFERHPQAAKYFTDTDMERQALMVTMALNLVRQYYSEGYSTVEAYLRHLGTRHYDHKVPPDVYPIWRDCMLETLAQFHDSDWSDELAAEWREAIDAVTKPMLEGYNRRTGV